MVQLYGGSSSYSLPSLSYFQVSVGGGEVIYNIRYSLREQGSPDRHPLTQWRV